MTDGEIPAAPRFASSAAASFAGMIVPAALTVALTLLLIRVLPKAEYGRYALIVSMIPVVLLIADLGVTPSTSRLIAHARGTVALQREILHSALALKLVTSAALALVFVLGAGPLSDAFDDPALEDGLQVTGLAAAAQSLVHLCRLALIADQAPAKGARVVVAESVLEVVICAAVVIATTSAAATLAGRSGAYLAGCGIGAVFLAQRFGWRPTVSRAQARHVARLAPTSAVAEVAWQLFLQSPIILIGLLRDSTDVATFEAPVRLLLLAGYLGAALGLATGPRLVDATRGARDPSELVRALRIVAVVQGALVPLWVLIGGNRIELVLGSEYASSADILLGMTPYFFLGGISPLLSYVIVYVGSLRGRAVAGLAALAATLTINLALLNTLGLAAAVIGSNVGVAIHALWIARLLAQELGISLWSMCRPVVVAGLIAAGVTLLGVLVAALVPFAADVIAFAALAAFLALTRRAGLWHPDEARALRRFVSRGGRAGT